MTLLGGLLLLAAVTGITVLIVAVIRHGRRETKAAEKLMDEVTMTILTGGRTKDDGKDG